MCNVTVEKVLTCIIKSDIIDVDRYYTTNFAVSKMKLQITKIAKWAFY